MIEFALVLPLFAMLVVGLFSSAMLYDSKMQLTHASREGARYGATIPVDQTFSSGTWASNVEDLVRQRGGDSLDGAEVCVALVSGNPAVAVSSDHSTEAGTAACYDDSASGEDEPRVQVSTSKTMPLDVVAFSRDVTLGATASSRHESHE
ncbi:MAG: TadE/TadG family type IV pilus assembly protein [Acidimicrobiales bacterium]